jgi:hypothetical protein
MERYNEDEWMFDFNDNKGSISVDEMTEEQAKQALCNMLSYWVELEDIRDSISDLHKKYSREI